MVSREQLRAAGLRAYELGRLRSAARIALVLLPLSALCLLESRGRETGACLAGLLLALAIGLRWWHRRGIESVNTGLLAGSLPLLGGLLLERLDLECGWAGGDVYCTVFALLVGGGAGAWIGAREHRAQGQAVSWAAAAGVAALAASLGCLRLGVVGLLSMLSGLALGIAATALLVHRRGT
jgi:hypothetical protein